MAARLRPPEKAVQIWHDGTELPANVGEPLAFALIAADRLALARSPKLHRPRGPFCFSGACDGCLLRVDGVPNVMTCMKRTHGGERLETQNVLGSRGTDLLRASDFLFPHGIDHHQLFAGVPIVSDVVQSFARRVAGLGQLPDAPELPQRAQKLSVDVAVVGGGRAGLYASRSLIQAGLGAIHLFDDQLNLGGNLRLLDPEAAQTAITAAEALGVTLHPETTAVGLFERSARELGPTLLVVNQAGATLVTARALILATGTQDRALLFGNNDLPGVFSARAALALLRAGISIGPRVLWIDGQQTGQAFEALAQGKLQITHATADSLLSAKGSARVTGARLQAPLKAWRGEAIVIDGARPKALQLAIQAGFELQFNGECYELASASSGPRGRVSAEQGVWVIGSAAQNSVQEGHSDETATTAIIEWLGHR